MKKAATVILSLSLLFGGGFVFYTTQQATSPACQEARKTKKTPSNRWIGIQDTPANDKEVDDYCNELAYVTPTIFTVFALAATLIQGSVCYFLLRFLMRLMKIK